MRVTLFGKRIVNTECSNLTCRDQPIGISDLIRALFIGVLQRDNVIYVRVLHLHVFLLDQMSPPKCSNRSKKKKMLACNCGFSFTLSEGLDFDDINHTKPGFEPAKHNHHQKMFNARNNKKHRQYSNTFSLQQRRQ